MKTAYTPDNTGRFVVLMVALAAIVTTVVTLVGSGSKPDVSTILIVPNADAVASSTAASTTTFGFDAGTNGDDTDSDNAATGDTGTADQTAEGAESGVLLDELGQPFGDATESGDDTNADATNDGTAATTDAEGRSVPEGEIILVPTSEPTPTPEVAAAVQPTPIPSDDGDSASADVPAIRSAPSLPTSSGSVQGSFFTRSDENEGAIVSQNLITLSFAEDGSGAFQGVLDITYDDETHILLNMSGPLTWAPTNPQVEAVLTGAFTLDAPIDADDVTADDAELTITSLEAGSGSLCTTKCFGFTFPPQTG